MRIREGEWVDRSLQTNEELETLVLAAQAGDAEAMNELAWRVQPLVLRLANKYRHSKALKPGTGHGRYSYHQREEMLQECWAGFADAVERYDPEHEGGRKFWTVVGYRVKEAVQQWQSKHSGGLGMPRRAWQDAWRIDQELEAANIPEWERLTDGQLKELTGVHSAGSILRARTPGHTLWPDDDGRSSQGAEDEYVEQQTHMAQLQLLGWMDGLHDIPEQHWEAATYWMLEHLGLADEYEAQVIVDRWRASVCG